jgi:hypothetical protein|tara:strand:- start:1648 stop:2259 length:612 start_codon:yes stop_codon:yes gene_type:complete
MEKPSVHKRNAMQGRSLRMAMDIKTAREAIGDIKPGCEIFGLTKGDFSLISVIEHILNQTGPAHVVVSTWTAAAVDIQKAEKFLFNKMILSLQFLVDQSFRSRQPDYCARLVAAFGPAAIRYSRSHCKFVVIYNDKWNVVVRTSMNLNENRRIENFEISDDPAFTAFMLELRDELFAKPENFTEEDFKGLCEGGPFASLRGWS